MPQDKPAVLIVTTQNWLQITRLALRFARHGCKVSALCPPHSELRFSNHVSSCHSFQHWNLVESLRVAIEKSHADYLVPGDDMALWLLHELGARFPAYLGLIERSLGVASSFATVRSRYRLLSLAAELGIQVPHTAHVRTVEEVREWSRESSLPFLVKKDGTWGGGGVEIVTDHAALPQHYARLTTLPTVAGKLKRLLFAADRTAFATFPCLGEAEISVQAYVEGVAANAMFACHEGRILGEVQARVVAAKGKTGPALMIELLQNEQIARAGRLLAASLRLSGFFGLDFILDAATGAPFLIEMNPRCTQLGHIAVNGQPDLARLLSACWMGQTPSAPANAQLSNSVCFYPQALEWDPQSRFLERARFDVCTEDQEAVDTLAKGNPALLSRTYRTARTRLATLKHSYRAASPSRAFYFEAAVQTQS